MYDICAYKKETKRQLVNPLTFCMYTMIGGMYLSLSCSRMNKVCGLRMKIFDFPYFTSSWKPMCLMRTWVPSREVPRKLGHVILLIILYLGHKVT